mmetsp:Transcript_11997/g.39478  ORF Transcript_11997/g.39478 Transcript_11997/m.39478 type:complete len:251 (-) Transcript_11997:323-1075(-)
MVKVPLGPTAVICTGSFVNALPPACPLAPSSGCASPSSRRRCASSCIACGAAAVSVLPPALPRSAGTKRRVISTAPRPLQLLGCSDHTAAWIGEPATTMVQVRASPGRHRTPVHEVPKRTVAPVRWPSTWMERAIGPYSPKSTTVSADVCLPFATAMRRTAGFSPRSIAVTVSFNLNEMKVASLSRSRSAPPCTVSSHFFWRSPRTFSSTGRLVYPHASWRSSSREKPNATPFPTACMTPPAVSTTVSRS